MGGFDSLKAELAERKAQHLYRSRLVVDSPVDAKVTIEGQSYHCFCSNDYLGLANHPEIIASLQQAAAEHGVGSGASHLITGHHQIHHQLEDELAAFLGYERALVFSSGYMANIGAIRGLLRPGDAIFEDRLNHASLLDGGWLSRADFHRYAHCDTTDLATQLAASGADRKLVVTDGLFSMDGDIAPLAELSEVTRQHDAWLMVDDAHGLGVVGESGRGSMDLRGVGPDQVQVFVGTLGKGFGTAGAFVAGSELVIESLIQYARTYIYTTAMPMAIAQATRTSLQLVQRESWRRDKLQQLIAMFRQGAAAQGLTLAPSSTPVQPLLVGDEQLALQLSQQLKARGFLVTAIRPPTVPKGTARLRITLSAAHSEQQVKQLLDALAEVYGELKGQADSATDPIAVVAQ